jgi:hypothetical protein
MSCKHIEGISRVTSSMKLLSSHGAAERRWQPANILYYGPILRCGNNYSEQYPKKCYPEFRPCHDVFIKRDIPQFCLYKSIKVPADDGMPAGLILKSRSRTTDVPRNCERSLVQSYTNSNAKAAGLAATSFRVLDMF